MWRQLPGKRDELAALTGISGSELSSYNSGKRRLGMKNANRIVDALASKGIAISVLELGASVGLAEDQGMTLLRDRLEAIADALDVLARGQHELLVEVRRLGPGSTGVGVPRP